MLSTNDAHAAVRTDFHKAIRLSTYTALLMAGMSLLSLLFPDWVYATRVQREAFLPNDLVNLILGLPVLLLCIRLASQKQPAGLLLLPGGLVYILYNNIALVFGQPFNGFTPVNALVLTLSGSALFELVSVLLNHGANRPLASATPRRFAGWVLVLFGAMFLGIAAGELAGVGLDFSRLPLPDIGVILADLVVSFMWVAGGVLLLRKKPLGFVAALGLLFAAVELIAGLIIFLLIRPLLTGTPFDLNELAFVLGFGLVCSLPFFYFLRAVLSLPED